MTRSVSVIITCFNLERYIGEAIRSAIAQDLNRPAEVVVVDDSSTDGSAQIIHSFAGVRYVRTPRNSGVLLAMLEGIRSATGELLFFLDGDDVWEPGKLSACVAALEGDPACALVTHDLAFIDASGQALDRPSRPAEVLGILAEAEQGAKVIDGILHHGDFVWLGSALGVCRTMSKLEEFDRWARDLPDPHNTYQDWPLAFWVASLPGVAAAYVPQKLFRYRLHRANYSGDARSADRAVRNFTRSRNTLEAMSALATERNAAASVRNRLRARERAYAYLVTLYKGRRWVALLRFPGAAFDFLRRGELAKELARLAAILLVGPDRFAGRRR